MSKEASFDPIDKESNERMFGPRCILLCGANHREQVTIEAIAARFENLPIVVAGEDDLAIPVGQLLQPAIPSGSGHGSGLERLVLMSGLTEAEVHEFMDLYRNTSLARPLWATLTPTSATWPLSDLLGELDAERRAMSTQR